MPQQTAIEYLRTKLLEDSHLTVIDIFDKGREIEKQQIQNAYNAGYWGAVYEINFKNSIEYYNKTFNINDNE